MAFALPDIDAFNNMHTILSEEELQAAQERFEQEYLVLKALPVESGKQLAKLAESCLGDVTNSETEMSSEAEEAFALLTDYLRDWRDCASAYAEIDKLEIYNELQAYLLTLAKHQISIRYSMNKLGVTMSTDVAGIAPAQMQILHLVAFRQGEEPEEFAVPKSMSLGL